MAGKGCVRVGENCIKYLKSGWNRREEGEKRWGMLEPPYDPCFIWISKNNHSTECYLQYLPELPQEPDKKRKHGNENLQRASSYLHQIQKKHIQIQYVLNQLVKILQTVSL